MNTQTILYWYWPGFFLFSGLFLIWKTPYFGNVRVIQSIAARSSAADSSVDVRRVRDAVERRAQAEGAPLPLGRWIGILGIALGAADLAWHQFAPLYYALFQLGATLIAFAAFVRLRNVQRKRVAVLSPRRSAAVIPVPVLLGACVPAVLILSYATRPGMWVPAVLTSVASLACLAMAWRLTELPALMSGVDVPAEHVVDERMRIYRSTVALFWGVLPPFIFCTQAIGQATIAQLAAYVVSWIVAFGILCWVLWRVRRPLQLEPAA